MRTVVVSLVLAAQTSSPIFRFETDGFWLNLHHFLYVLGRVEAKMPDITRDAVAGAPADEAAGLKSLKAQPVFSTIKGARADAYVPWAAVTPPGYEAYARIIDTLVNDLKEEL